MRVYRDRRDWWVGYYRGDEHHYVCPLPTLVIRWRRRNPDRREPPPDNSWITMERAPGW